MNTKDTDILNVILIVISLVLAFNVPFGLFIFSYAVLGPLHYLTEINWLREKRYFVQHTGWIWVLVLLGCLVSLSFIFRLDFFTSMPAGSIGKRAAFLVNDYGDEGILISLLFAVGLINFKHKSHLAIFFIGSVAVALPMLYFFPAFALAVLIFIPTVIHVYLFTLLFMIYGTLNSRSTPGIVAIILLALVPVFIIVSKIDPADYFTIRDFTRSSFNDSNFSVVSFQMAQGFSDVTETNFNFFSALGIKIQIFIAFAYTYHYLNWFSKTSIIGWNRNMAKNRAVAILIIWILSIALYVYNFKIGFIILGFMSLIHVFLEFPLNVTSVKGILMKARSKFISR